MDTRAQTKPCRWIDQECFELAAALIVAPIADPDEVQLLTGRRQRVKQGRVGSLVPSECSPRPAALKIDFTQHFAEGEDGFVAFDVELIQFRGISDRAVVRVVKQQYVGGPCDALPSDGGNETGRIPFVHDDKVGTVRCLLEVERLVAISMDRHTREQGGDLSEYRASATRQRIGAAPAVLGLIDSHLMPQSHQFAGKAAEEMHVAVIPARQDGVVEKNNFHAGTCWVMSRWVGTA